jgi:TRAP-type C4-dicarboxylate transport system permease large subunit
MVLFGPLLFPIARQLGVVVILAMGVGLFAPPFGLATGCGFSMGVRGLL